MKFSTGKDILPRCFESFEDCECCNGTVFRDQLVRFFKESLQSNDVPREQLIPRDQEILEAPKRKILRMNL